MTSKDLIPLRPVLASLIRDHQLPPQYETMALTHFTPIIHWLHDAMMTKGGMYVFGLSGAQGTGKSTLADLLHRYFTQSCKLNVAVVSLDDFYYTRARRQQLAEVFHPLLETRGPPGTHNIELACQILSRLEQHSAGSETALPRFDKATDDRLPATQWPVVRGPLDLLILEGWCVGSESQTEDALAAPINSLEQQEDKQGIWRRYANRQLIQYQQLFDRLDGLAYLRAPDFETILGWRLRQEQLLAATASGAAICTMTESEIVRFVGLFERLTRASQTVVADKADIVVSLDTNHLVKTTSIR